MWETTVEGPLRIFKGLRETNRIEECRDSNRTSHLIFKFDNGYGASVINGPFSYGGGRGLFELAVLDFTIPVSEGAIAHITYDTPIGNGDVLGYLTYDDVNRVLEEIEGLPRKEMDNG